MGAGIAQTCNFDIFFLFGFCFVLFLFFVFVFFFLIIQSQAAFVNCLYVARFTIVHSKTQIKFPFGYYISSSSSPSLSLLLLLLFNYHPSNYYPSLKNLHSSTKALTITWFWSRLHSSAEQLSVLNPRIFPNFPFVMLTIWVAP